VGTPRRADGALSRPPNPSQSPTPLSLSPAAKSGEAVTETRRAGPRHSPLPFSALALTAPRDPPSAVADSRSASAIVTREGGDGPERTGGDGSVAPAFAGAIERACHSLLSAEALA
jgi:hypothetical protein